MASLRRVAVITGGMLVMIVRSFTLWLFFVPAFIVGLLLLPGWVLLRLAGVEFAASPMYCVRWSAVLHDALLTRLLPIQSMPWPWQVDVLDVMPRPFVEAF